jgi:hypothetical protein
MSPDKCESEKFYFYSFWQRAEYFLFCLLLYENSGMFPQPLFNFLCFLRLNIIDMLSQNLHVDRSFGHVQGQTCKNVFFFKTILHSQTFKN